MGKSQQTFILHSIIYFNSLTTYVSGLYIILEKNMFNNEEPRDEQEFEFVNVKNDPYAYYRGEYVRIGLTNTSFVGMYKGITNNGQLILNPHLRYTVGQRKDSRAILEEKPFFVTYSATCALGPEEKEEILKVIEKHNSKTKEKS